MTNPSCIAPECDMNSIEQLIVWIPALPLAAAVITAVLGPRLLRHQSHLPVIGALAASCVLSFLLLFAVRDEHRKLGENNTGGFERIVTLWTWASVDDAYQQSSSSQSDASKGGMRDFVID